MHLPEAKKKVEELTQKPDPKPIKWKKWLLIILAILAIAVFLIHQRKCHQWPFGKKIYPPKPPITIVENVDSLQWAIDNHNISMLEKYANLDSMRAYFPLANELFAIGNDDYNTFGRWIVKSFNSPDSIRGRNLWDRYAQPIVDEMTKSITSSFNEIDWSNSDYAEKRCLSIYSSYVTNIESSIKLLQQPQQITSLENKAIDYLTSWERVKSKGNYFSSDAKLRYNEWRNLNDRLNFAISNKDELIRANYYKIKYDEK